METDPRPANPPPDPDEIDDDARYTGEAELSDTDSEPATSPEDLEEDSHRDQAEG
jgi:hypothetical protein